MGLPVVAVRALLLAVRESEGSLPPAVRAAWSRVAETLAAREAAEWVSGNWSEVRAGDQVRAGGTVATVVTVLPLRWLKAGTREIRVVLTSRVEPYGMRPSAPVEIRRVATDHLLTGDDDWSFLAALDALRGLGPGVSVDA